MRRFLLVAIVYGLGCGSTAAPPPPACLPGASGPTWVSEGGSVTVAVICTSGLELAASELALTDLPAGALYDPAVGELRWTPALDQAAVYEIGATVIATGERGVVVVGVADAFDTPGNVPVIDRAAYPLEYGVPVLFLDPPPSQDEIDEPITITYGGRTFAGRGEMRGASSLSYPKKSYLLKFEADAQFYDLDRDFVGKRRVVLTSTFDDNAYIRQRLAFELWNALEPSLPIRAYSVVVYVSGEFWGLYTITDFPGDHWLEELGYRGDGNLYKAINHDANFYATDYQGNPKATLHQGYEKKEGAPGDFSDLDALVDLAVSSPDGEFASNLGAQIEVSDLNKWWALAVFSLAVDSAGKNSYLYHGDDAWLVAPWDFNASFGQSWETSRLPATAVDLYEGNNGLFARSLADPVLGPAIRATLRDAITSGPFSSESLDDRVAALIAELDATARRDWRKWAADYATHPRWSGRSDMTDYDGEIAYLLSWLEARGDAVLGGL